LTVRGVDATLANAFHTHARRRLDPQET